MLEEAVRLRRIVSNYLVDRDIRVTQPLTYQQAVGLIDTMRPAQIDMTPKKPLRKFMPRKERRDLFNDVTPNQALAYLAKVFPAAMQEGLSAQHTVFSETRRPVKKHYIDIFQAYQAAEGTEAKPAKKIMLRLDYLVKG